MIFVVKNGKGFPVLVSERWAWSWSRCTLYRHAACRYYKSSTRW